MDSCLTLLKLRLKTIFNLDQKESELDQEMRFHLENLIEENLKKGIELEHARNEALKKFGNLEEHKGQCREMWWRISALVGIKKSICLIDHSIWKSPGFSFAVIGTLALSIGAISALYGFTLRAVSFENSEPLVQSLNPGEISTPDNESNSSNSPQHFYSKEQNDLLKGFALRQPLPKSINRGPSIRKVQTTWGNKHYSDQRMTRKRIYFNHDRTQPTFKSSYPLRINFGSRSKNHIGH